jgi:hypothetical protein
MSHPSVDGTKVRASRRGYRLTAGVLLVMMLGGTLPIPLYMLYEKQIGFGPLGVTVVFVAYVLGTLLILVALGDLSDHVGRGNVLALAVFCAAVSSGLFLAASGIGLLIVARVVRGMAAGFATGTATAALAELQPRGDRAAAAVVASGSNMTGLGLGALVAGLFAEWVSIPTHSVFRTACSACSPGSPFRRAWERSCSAHAWASSPRSASPACSAASCRHSCMACSACTTWLSSAGILPDLHHRRDQPGRIRAAACPPQRKPGVPLLLVCLGLSREPCTPGHYRSSWWERSPAE